MVDSRILCRMRAVRIVNVRNMVKYQSAGRLPFGSQGSIEYHFDLQPRTPFCCLRGTFPQGKTRRYGTCFLCHQCCMPKSQSPLPQAEVLPRTSEPGSCVSIACTQSEHLKARPAGGAVRRRRIGASGLSLKRFRPILKASSISFLRKESLQFITCRQC